MTNTEGGSAIATWKEKGVFMYVYCRGKEKKTSPRTLGLVSSTGSLAAEERESNTTQDIEHTTDPDKETQNQQLLYLFTIFCGNLLSY